MTARMAHLCRAMLALVLVLAATATRAAAETDLAVLPPLGKDVRDVQAALQKVRVGKLAKQSIDGACASDPQCLAKVGGELGARRVLAITVHGRRLTLTLVDADAKLLLGIRDISIPRSKLERALGPSLERFVDQVTADKVAAEHARGAGVRERAEAHHPARPWMLLTGGLGLATAGAGVYFGVLARADQRRFDAAGCATSDALDSATVAQCKSDRKQGDRDTFLRNVLVGSGGAVVLASLIVYAIDPGHFERPTRTAIALTRDAVHVVVRW
jgi:hypothetical protein